MKLVDTIVQNSRAKPVVTFRPANIFSIRSHSAAVEDYTAVPEQQYKKSLIKTEKQPQTTPPEIQSKKNKSSILSNRNESIKRPLSLKTKNTRQTKQPTQPKKKNSLRDTTTPGLNEETVQPSTLAQQFIPRNNPLIDKGKDEGSIMAPPDSPHTSENNNGNTELQNIAAVVTGARTEQIKKIPEHNTLARHKPRSQELAEQDPLEIKQQGSAKKREKTHNNVLAKQQLSTVVNNLPRTTTIYQPATEPPEIRIGQINVTVHVSEPPQSPSRNSFPRPEPFGLRGA